MNRDVLNAPRRRIVRHPPVDVGAALPEVPALLRPVLWRRGVSDAADIDYALNGLLDFRDLPGVDEGVEVLVEALEHDQSILIVGDYDADGATSCALAVLILRAMGAKRVGYLVPNRQRHGYGLSPAVVAGALEWNPDLIITVDNGVASLEGVAAANAHDIAVLVTDHHLPGTELPAAAALVNPNLADSRFASPHLAGVGVIFYLLMALRARLREDDWFSEHSLSEPNLAEVLDLVALGTVADVVPLDRNNRILVAQGLARIRAGQCRTGIRALVDVAGRELDRLSAADLAFAVAPRLNAAGRLEDMALGIECLLADDAAHARRLAVQLDTLNRARREIETDMQAEAVAALARVAFADGVPSGICLAEPGWHEGVVGILASRLKDRFQRPAIAFAETADGSLKGSARSLPGLHIRDVLAAIASQNPGLIERFGGHAMAAGLTLDKAHFDAFAAAFRAHLDGADALPDADTQLVMSDGEIPPERLDLDLAENIARLGPWGQHFPEPIFDGHFEISSLRTVSGGHLKLTVRADSSTIGLPAIWFNPDADPTLSVGTRVQLAYRLVVNQFQGLRKPELIVECLAAD
jgi:single-stranded-DNA-specific exonuclease